MNSLQNISLFETLDELQIKELEKISKIKNFEKEQIIFFEGEEAKYLHVIVHGKVAVYKTKENANETIINVFYADELFAEAPCINGFNYPASAKCLEQSSILIINYYKFKELFLKDASIGLQIMSALSKKIKKLSSHISDAQKPLAERLARYLLDYNLKAIKNKELAMRLNVRAETLSRTLAKFKDEGIITNGLVDRQKLACSRYISND